MTGQTLETERMRLVQPQAEHTPAYRAYCASDRSRFVGGPFSDAKAFEKLCAMAGQWTLRGFGRFIMTLKSTDEAIGHVGALQHDDQKLPDLTWTIWNSAFEGKGYAFEAVQAYLAAAPESFGAERFMIYIDPENQRSLNLAHRVGAIRDSAATLSTLMPNTLIFSVRL
ncbi:MAG: GNAT family N-acetyltransferase [Yoonia sp.]|uniref:GNAT family N-acetyltransferase n=1 Tax=Yoonia sp. TaxID=2212373 RepID=UPI003EF1B593